MRSAHVPWLQMIAFPLAILLPFVLYWQWQKGRQRETEEKRKAISRRLEPIIQWAIQIYEHAERDEVRRLELSLRLKEAETYTRFLNKDALK